MGSSLLIFPNMPCIKFCWKHLIFCMKFIINLLLLSGKILSCSILIHRVHTTFSEKLTKIKVKKLFFLTTWIHQNLTERPVFRVQRRMAKRLTAEWTRTQFKCQTYCKVTLWRQQRKHIWTHTRWRTWRRSHRTFCYYYSHRVIVQRKEAYLSSCKAFQNTALSHLSKQFLKAVAQIWAMPGSTEM